MEAGDPQLIFMSCVWRDCGKLSFFLCLCLLGFVCSATGHDSPAALHICLAESAVASSIWLMPDYYIISQDKLAAPHLGSATSAWWCQVREGERRRAVDQAD